MDTIDQLKQDVREGRIDVDRLIDVIVGGARPEAAAVQAARGRVASRGGGVRLQWLIAGEASRFCKAAYS